MKSFLIVDDDANLCVMYERFIRKHFSDAIISKAANGKEALEKAGLFDYSVILSDINMPEMDGISFYRNLKKEYPLLTHKVGFISACLTEEDLCYFTKEEIPYLLKPFKKEEFFSLIDNILSSEKKRLNEEIGNGCQRRYERANARMKCVLEPLNVNTRKLGTIRGEIVDFSKGGFGLRYKGEIFGGRLKANVSIESMDIFNRKAEMVWAHNEDENVRSGFRWL